MQSAAELTDVVDSLNSQMSNSREGAARQLDLLRTSLKSLDLRIASLENVDSSSSTLSKSSLSTSGSSKFSPTSTTTTTTTSSTTSTPTTSIAAPSPSPYPSHFEWHPWDRAPPPPESRILARSHWRDASEAPVDYPYEVDAPFVHNERPAMVLEELQYMRGFVDPYTLYRKRAQRDRRFLKLSDVFQFDTSESEMRIQSDAIQRHLTQLQNPALCDASHRYVLFSFSTYLSYGFGAAVRHLAMALDYAISRRRILIVQEGDEFSYADREQTPLSTSDVANLRTAAATAASSFGFAGSAPVAGSVSNDERCGGGWLCYFEAPSKCTRQGLIDERLPMRAQILYEQSRYEQVSIYSSRGRTYDEVLLQLGDDRLHDLYWHAQLVRFLFKPVAVLRARLEQWRAPPVAVHMRQGDKAGELAGRALTAWQYYDAILAARDHSDVFAATDGAAVLSELKRLGASRSEFRVLHLEEERHNDAMQLLLREHSVNRKREAVAAIGNIWLLAQSETLIGYTWSKFCALAFELQYSRDEHKTTLIDVLNGTWTPF